MGRILLWLSGVNRAVLAETPGDTAKYEGLGGVVLTTACMAALSSALAVNLALQTPIIICVLIGLGWGLAIANLDRWLISAFPRRDKVWKNLAQALPRFLMALIIGLVVSTPLVLKVFDNEINDQIRTTQNQNLGTKTAGIEKRYDVPGLQGKVDRDNAMRLAKGNQDQIVRADPSVAAAGTLVANATKAWRDAVAAGSSDAGAKLADKVKRDKEYAATVKAAVPRLNTQGKRQLPSDLAALKTAINQRDADLAGTRKDILKDKGLIARDKALNSIRAGDSSVNAIYLVLWAFITLIEILPVLLKFLMTLGPPSAYELALIDYNADQLVQARHSIEMGGKIRAQKRETDAEIAKERNRIRAEYQTEQMKQKAERRTNRGSSLFGP